MINRIEQPEISQAILSSPALLFLYHRVEQILGIKATDEAIVKLNEYLEKTCGASFIENPAAFEHTLVSREQIFEIAKLLTINETYFFREGVHFELLVRLLPQLAKGNRRIQICSAATSTGCEAYSIAMLLDYHSNNGKNFDYEIDAFDISAETIETAKNARYTANALRADGAGWKYILDSYLVPDGKEYTVTPNIQGKVHFFTRNVMSGLDRRYDVIFFRNALIYFTPLNRHIVLDNLAAALSADGLLFLGISETASVSHPLLESRCLPDVFYFQKKADGAFHFEQPELKQSPSPAATRDTSVKRQAREAEKPVLPKHADLPVDCTEMAAILNTKEGQSNARMVLDILKNTSAGSPPILNGSQLASCAVYLLGKQDFMSADHVLTYLEKHSSGTVTLFLRGEYYFLRNSAQEAERYFEDAAGKDKAFWPAFYRIATLAAGGNKDRYNYKVKKACESIELGSKNRYECFMGGFSPDYFRRILEKKLA